MSTVALSAGDARAAIAVRGGELVAWRAGGHDLLWSGDPSWWGRSSPILFPIVGWARDQSIRIDGKAYPMGVHGFAGREDFAVESASETAARLVLTDNAETLRVFPFPFRLTVSYALAETELSVRFEVVNLGERPLPYALGLHPGFRWPFAAGRREGHVVCFDEPERPQVPVIAPGGLFSPERRSIPLEGRRLRLDDDLFSREALCFLNARSRRVSLSSPDGGPAITMDVEDFPHFALWTKPGAPFLSIEAWTGYGDPTDFEGDLSEKPSMRLLAPGTRARHAVRLIFRPEGTTLRVRPTMPAAGSST
jgi:galactose mutarotase-like enzyme